MNKIEYTEQSVLRILNSNFLSNPKYLINNLYVFGWESDYLAFTKSGYWYEVEVKISRADFKADMNKIKKHDVLSGEIVNARKPNYFYYAVPEGLIQEKDIPVYAGLIYITGNNNSYKIIRTAPKLHKEKLKINLQDKFYYNWKSEMLLRKRLQRDLTDIYNSRRTV